jgi:hypothetical protein
MPVDPETDFHWQAFRYISGEMPLDEVVAFEELLLVDQIARDAVASAVELVQAVATIGPESLRKSRIRPVPWLVTVAAAATLLALATIPSWHSPRPVEPDPSDVAITWSDLRDGMDADWKALVAGSAPSEPMESSLPVENDAVENPTERPLPSWLLSAASVPQADSPLEEN